MEMLSFILECSNGEVGGEFGTTKFRILNKKFQILRERKMSYLIFYFRIYFSFLYLFKLFEHSKYMIIQKIGNL